MRHFTVSQERVRATKMSDAGVSASHRLLSNERVIGVTMDAVIAGVLMVSAYRLVIGHITYGRTHIRCLPADQGGLDRRRIIVTAEEQV